MRRTVRGTILCAARAGSRLTRSLGQHEIPALVVDADTEDCMVMSLVENLARRQHRAIDLLHDIEGLEGAGLQRHHHRSENWPNYRICQRRSSITSKRRASTACVRSRPVKSRSASPSKSLRQVTTETQVVLQQAYEKKLLRGQKLIAARRLIEQRRRRGKGLKNKCDKAQGRARPLSSNALIRAYQEDVDRKRLLIRKAETTRNRLIFVTEALRKLFADENFVTLLRAEGLDTLLEISPVASRSARRPDDGTQEPRHRL